MGVAYASGLSKNGSWSDTDAIAPVMKVEWSVSPSLEINMFLISFLALCGPW